MIRTAAPEPSAVARQSTPGRRPSASASHSSARSSPASTLSTREQRQLQLQLLQQQQQQQQQRYKQQRKQQIGGQFLSASGHSQGEQQYEPTWASQGMKDTWIAVAQDAGEPRLDRRHSHLSDKHMNLGPMKLLSDETPPDDMDGSWGLDDLDDDHRHPPYDSHTSFIPTATPTLRHNEQNDSNITKNNNDHPTTTTPTINDNSRSKTAHGYVHMGKQKGALSEMEVADSGSNDVHGDADHHSSSSFLSTHVRKSPSASRKNSNSSKYPWRDSKHETIFTDLVDDGYAQMEQLQDHTSLAVTPRSQPIARNDNQDGNTSEGSSSLSLSDIIDAVNKGEESIDPARSSKYEQARRRLAQLSPAGNLHEESSNDLPSPAAESPAARVFQNKQEAFKQQRLRRVMKAAMNIDPNDNRSHVPSEEMIDATDLATTTPGQLHIKSSDALSKPQFSIPASSRFSYGSRHRSQGSRDAENGDRGSTTSRDSVYRDSLSGSTLGSAGFHAQLEGMNKHEMANVFTALKSAAVAQLFSSDPDPKQSTTRILPHNVNSKSLSPADQHEDAQAAEQAAIVDLIISEDRDATPRPRGRIPISSVRVPDSHLRRFNPENDRHRANQYATLAAKGLSKQTSSFVEDLANATALKSATDSSFKNTPSPTSKEAKRQLTSDDQAPTRSQDHNDRERREVTFKSVSTLDKQHYEDNGENSDAELDELGSLIGSRGMENAFKSLEDLDVSFDVRAELKDADIASTVGYEASSRPQVDDGAGEYLTAVALPSKPKRRGDHSLKWENQLDTVSNADTSRFGINTSISRTYGLHNTSIMMPEQSSFSHAEGHLIRYITGLHPWDEWDQVKTLDLTKREVESTIKLNHLVPNLEVLILNDNQVSYLTGIPKSVKTLQVRSNLLSNLTNFSHLVNLQYLDISHNDIEDLTGLSSLVHLRELMAEGNRIKSVSALQQMDGLIRLDVSRNCLTSLDFRWSKLQRLEFLNASHNKIEQLENLESLAGLIHANLAHNCIEDISLIQSLRRLRILRLSENKLATFDATPFPGLRTLYLDDNRLQSLENCQKLTRLENFSARDQEGEGIAIDMTEFINSRKLYLSGNPIHALDFEMGFYRLEYLEVCAGCLSELPLDFATLFPNLRGLNLSYNSLDSISALDGLHRLRRLIFVGNSLKSFSDVLSLLKRMRSLVTLDLRHNPLTSNMYPAMSIRQGSKYQDTYRTNQNSETEQDWRRRDVGFRRSLPDAMYVKRSVYRSAILKSCKRLEWFDGGAVQLKERERAPVVLEDMLENYGRNYLVNNRREDDEEDFEFEEGQNEYYAHEEIIDQQQQEADWLYSRGQLAQLNQEEQFQEDEDEDFDRDERDPEDVSDNSKRPGSSVDSGSLNGQSQPKSPLTRFSGVSQQSQQSQPPRRLRYHSGYQIMSPSPKGATLTPRTSSSTTRVGLGRINSSSTVSQQLQQQQQAADQPISGSVKQRTTSVENPAIGHGDGEEGEHATYEASSDRRSAVRNWRDEVNEVSHRKTQSPRVAPSAASVGQEARSGSQQYRQSEKGSASGSSRGSKSGSVSGARSYNNVAPETSTTAVANNSGENQGQNMMGTPRRRRTIGSAQKFSIPQPPVFQQQHHRSSVHSRGRSDSASALMMAANATGATPTQMSRRPLSQHGVFGIENRDAGIGSPLHHSLHQLSLSPMGGPSGMTASGTMLRPANHRRRSFAVYPHGSANARKKELLGLDTPLHQQQSSSQLLNGGAAQTMSMSASTHVMGQSPAASPGYFGTSHHGMQSPFGFGKGAATPGGRSGPNTPSRGGRASRVSVGAAPHHYPQTLARDMEMAD